MTGTTVGHYEILEKLGEGGMGMVYKARDILLNRTAALKFLPPESAAADDKRARFVQEAQAASALNHPNIITIYEVGQAGDRDFIAMELVQGQALDREIGRKALSIEKAVAYGIQIADALAAAHAAGIVHRDLKPGNVMTGGSGVVKVLDFGLAKLVTSGATPSDATRTILAGGPKTADGAILGTVSYMSPEQAEGKPVDHRSDIFSFGALLYEMLTGRQAFHGDSAVSTLAAILTAEPAPLSVEVQGVPLELARIVSRCLRKAPEKRWQSIADVRIALEEFRQDLESGRLAAAPAAAAASQRRWVSIVLAVLATAALAGFAVSRLRSSTPPPELWQIRRLTSDAGTSMFPAISQDGKLVAYISDRAAGDSQDLWVQQIGGGDPVQLTRDLQYCRQPAFSPDASRIVLHCGKEPDGIYIVPALGGLTKKVAEGDLPHFSPDGSQISYVAASSADPKKRSLWTIPAEGGTAKEIKVDKGINSRPVWTRDGKGLLFVGFGDQQNGKDERDWYFVAADGSSPVPTAAAPRLQAAGLGNGRDLALTPNGVLFADGNLDSTNIYRMPFDAAFRKASGDPVPLIVGAGFSFSPVASQDGLRMAFTVGNNLSVNIWRVPLDAGTGKASGEPVRVTSGLEPSLAPSPSRDGKHVVYIGGTLRAREIRIRDLTTGKDLRLADARDWSYAVLSQDGSTIAFSSDQRENSPLYSIPASGGPPKKICAACGRPVDWSVDRSKLLFDNAGPQRRDIHVLDLASGQTKVLLQQGEFQLTMPRLSPDGKSLLFSSLRPGRARRIYLAPFTGELVPEKDWTLLVDGTQLDRQPAWAPSGNLVYFLSDRDGSRCIWAQRVDAATRRPAGEPFAVHHLHQIRYNLSDLGDPASVGLSVAGGQLFYASFELQSNIWLAEKRQPAAK